MAPLGTAVVGILLLAGAARGESSVESKPVCTGKDAVGCSAIFLLCDNPGTFALVGFDIHEACPETCLLCTPPDTVPTALPTTAAATTTPVCPGTEKVQSQPCTLRPSAVAAPPDHAPLPHQTNGRKH